MEDRSSLSMHKYHFSADLLTKFILLIVSLLSLVYTIIWISGHSSCIWFSVSANYTFEISSYTIISCPPLSSSWALMSVARSSRSTRTDTFMFMWLQLMFIIVIWSQRIYWLMLTVNLKYVILDWPEWHSMILLQQYSGRYVDSGRLDSYSTFFKRLYSYSVSQKNQDYVATRWYRAPELCGSFFSKVTNLHILI